MASGKTKTSVFPFDAHARYLAEKNAQRVHNHYEPRKYSGRRTHGVEKVGLLSVDVPGSDENSHVFDGGELGFPGENENNISGRVGTRRRRREPRETLKWLALEWPRSVTRAAGFRF